MRRLWTAARILIWGGIAAAGLLVGYAFVVSRPEDLPWTRLDLGRPIGLFTGRKLAALTTEPEQCRAARVGAGIAHRWLPPSGRAGGEVQCGYADAVRLVPVAGQARLSPADVAPSCPVVAALKLWEWQVVQPAAERLLGSPVRTIETFGAYSCRRLYGRSAGDMSEHATADAIDVAGFVLDDGRRVSVVGDWDNGDGKTAFLREVRDGACGLFSTVLSPEYNRAHRDHLHLDQAERGATGWRACR